MRFALLIVTLGLPACTGKDPVTPSDDSTPADDSSDDSGTSSTAYGPENGWYHAPDASLVPDEPETPRWTEGSMPPNLRFTDQNGDEVWLYQFYGQTVYLDWVAEWCGPCGTYAPYLDAFYQEHSADAVVLTVMLQDSGFADGDAPAVGRWVEAHESTNPVVWMDAEQLNRALSTSTFPTITLLDPELRMAQRSVNTLYNDAYIDQIIDRMALAIGGNLDNDAEVCDDGFDDDLDLIADCMDPACADASACALTEYTGSVSPCTPDSNDLTTTVDVWQVEVRGAVAYIESDTVSASTGFESIVRARRPDQSWADARNVGDDEWDCTYTLETFGCARGWLRPGTYELAIYPGTGGSDTYDGDCVDPQFGEYVLRAKGDVSMTLLRDNVQRSELAGL